LARGRDTPFSIHFYIHSPADNSVLTFSLIFPLSQFSTPALASSRGAPIPSRLLICYTSANVLYPLLLHMRSCSGVTRSPLSLTQSLPLAHSRSLVQTLTLQPSREALITIVKCSQTLEPSRTSEEAQGKAATNEQPKESSSGHRTPASRKIYVWDTD
jgi:hypothetical protein